MLRRVGTSVRATRSFSSVPVVPMWIDNKAVQSKGTTFTDVWDSSTGEVIARTPNSTAGEMKEALDSCAEAYKIWGTTAPSTRARVMHKYEGALRDNTQELSKIITRENGKTFADAAGDVFRGLEVVEHACTVPTLMQGETLAHLSVGLDTTSYQLPLGVVAGVTPFNFPAMVPLWMFPLACTAGNTFLLKPSERVPLTSLRLAELAADCGLPKGVLNIIHGTHSAVNFVCDEPQIRAVSFVGGNAAGKHIYSRCAQNGKRAQSNMGAKNHAIVLPDADFESVANQLVGASLGAAGQRCMAISVAVLVGKANMIVPKLVEKALKLKVGPGDEAGVDVGPVISAVSRDRINGLIEEGVQSGAEMLLDGRNPAVDAKYKNGFWVGPTILGKVKTNMSVYQNEIFGPVLAVVEVDTLDEAIALVNANDYGNGAAVFTRSGAAARKATFGLEAGQIGVNLPIPVPLPMFSFTGNKASIHSDLNFYGKMGVKFYTQTKTVTTNWKPDDHTEKLSFTMPTLG